MGPVLLNIFINDIDRRIECILEGIKCTISKFTDGTKSSSVVDTPEGWDGMQRDKLKKWAQGNLIKFDKTKCKGQHLCQGKPHINTGWGLHRSRAALPRS